MNMLWLPIAATCLIGVSCGLPLFLYLRERRLARDISTRLAQPCASGSYEDC
jgi:uncharacterized protein DUF2834